MFVWDLGGLPITQVMRSSANIQSGGRTKNVGYFTWWFVIDIGYCYLFC
jgi:MFS superfamily sulfate permease-like transporter